MGENNEKPRLLGRKRIVPKEERTLHRNVGVESVPQETLTELDIIATEIIKTYGNDPRAIAEFNEINSRRNFDRFDDYDMLSPHLRNREDIEKRPGVFLGLAYRWIELRKSNLIR